MAAAAPLSAFSGFRFPREVITVAVRWYLRYGLSYRDVEELLAERGVRVDHVSVYRWLQRFTPDFLEAARPCGRHISPIPTTRAHRETSSTSPSKARDVLPRPGPIRSRHDRLGRG